jgi:hypothetical protein
MKNIVYTEKQNANTKQIKWFFDGVMMLKSMPHGIKT